jgi:chloride channel 2
MLYDEFVKASYSKRKLIASSNNEIFNYFFWVISCVLLFLLATSPGYFVTADADGSGIPEMKTVLSGITLYTYFSFKSLVAKMVGLYGCLVGGKYKLL